MKPYSKLTKEELKKLKGQLEKQFEEVKAKGIHLDMSRGKPSKAQLDLSNGLMDVLNGSVLGQQALAFVTLCYFTTTLARRISWFGPFGQSLHILPLLLLSQVLVMLVRLWFDGLWPGWEWFLQSLTGAAIWPLWAKLLKPRSSRATSL